MAPANTDKFTEVGSPGTATTLDAPGHTIGGTTLNVISTTNWPTTTGAVFAMDEITIVNGEAVRTAGTYRECIGVVTGPTSIGSVTFLYGADRNYPAGSTTRVYIPVSSSRENRLVQGISVEHNQDGTHSNVTATSLTATTGTFTNLIVNGVAGVDGYTPVGATPNTVTALGQRSYSMVFNTNDLTDNLSVGMRLKTSRTVTAPTKCTDLESSSSQYYSKSSPAGMTFTDDFVVSAWVNLESYSADMTVASRYNATSGWAMRITSNGIIALAGFNAGAANFSQVLSYQSVPLGRWVHIAAQLDMSSFSATTTTSYVMIDGIDVGATVTRGGTNPTALVQAGNLNIGAENGGTTPFDGKLAQVAIYSAKVTQANIRATISQGLGGTETSLISAYSFNNSINDLNANANNLTANGSAVATSADSPFAGGVSASTAYTAGTTDYGIITAIAFSTNTTVTVQVPQGYTIPTTGGVSAVSYSAQAAPLGFPKDRGLWRIQMLWRQANAVASNATFAAYAGWSYVVPIGAWDVGYAFGYFTQTSTSIYFNQSAVDQTGLATSASDRALQTFVIGIGGNTNATQILLKSSVTLAAASIYKLYTSGGTTSVTIDGNDTLCEAFAEFNLI